MDTLKDVNAVLVALENFKTALTKIKDTSKLEDNKNTISKAWQSANAESFIEQYNTLITSLTSAYQNLESYQGKIEAVVQEITNFDQTIVSGQ